MCRFIPPSSLSPFFSHCRSSFILCVSLSLGFCIQCLCIKNKVANHYAICANTKYQQQTVLAFFVCNGTSFFLLLVYFTNFLAKQITFQALFRFALSLFILFFSFFSFSFFMPKTPNQAIFWQLYSALSIEFILISTFILLFVRILGFL